MCVIWCVIDFAIPWPRIIRPSGQLAMLSRLTGAYQSEKASQEQVSDKAAAGVTALAKLVQIVGKDCGTQVKAVAAGYRQPALFSPSDCSPCQISAVYVFTDTGLPPRATCTVLQELAQAAKDLVAASDKTNQTQQVLLVSFCWCFPNVKFWSDLLILTLQTLQQYPAALHALTASCTSALGVVQSVLPLQHAAEEVCHGLLQQTTSPRPFDA